MIKGKDKLSSKIATEYKVKQDGQKWIVLKRYPTIARDAFPIAITDDEARAKEYIKKLDNLTK